VKELNEAFSRADTPEVIRLLDKDFGKNIYSLKSLFRDEQNRIISMVLESTLKEVESTNRRVYEQHVPLMHFLADMGVPQPRIFHLMAELALDSQIREALEEENLDIERIQGLRKEAATTRIPLDTPTLEHVLSKTTERKAEESGSSPDDLTTSEQLEHVVNLAH